MWRPIEQIPLKKEIEALTVTGKVVLAKVHKKRILPPDESYNAKRVRGRRTNKGNGRVTIIGWRPV